MITVTGVRIQDSHDSWEDNNIMLENPRNARINSRKKSPISSNCVREENSPKVDLFLKKILFNVCYERVLCKTT